MAVWRGIKPKIGAGIVGTFPLTKSSIQISKMCVMIKLASLSTMLSTGAQTAITSGSSNTNPIQSTKNTHSSIPKRALDNIVVLVLSSGKICFSFFHSSIASLGKVFPLFLFMFLLGGSMVIDEQQRTRQ